MADLPEIDSYRDAATAIRDTTKWLTALVPGAGLVTVVARLVPEAAKITATPEFTVVAVAAAVAFLASSLIVVNAVRVFRVPVAGWGEAVRQASRGQGPLGPEKQSLAYDLDVDGVLRLHGYQTSEELFGAIAREETPTSDMVTAGRLVVDYAAFRSTRRAFLSFLWWGAAAFVVLVAAIGAGEYAIAQAGAPDDTAAIGGATAVELNPTALGQDALANELGCDDNMVDLVAWAVGGTFKEPFVVVDEGVGGCEAGSMQWRADFGAVVPIDG